MQNASNKMIGGILLVSGTTIGAGMLAMPVSTGLAGFLPSVLLLVCCWAFMTYTALLLLEVNLGMKEGSNLISMAKRTLGTPGEIVSWLAYLFLLYALTTAYIAGSGPIVSSLVHTLSGIKIPSLAGSIPLLLIFGLFVYKGTASVDIVNRLLMMGLVIAYGLMALFLTPHIELSLLARHEWPPLLLAVSLVVTSFGFHIIIPTLTTYLHKDVKRLKWVIIIGSTIPLIIYLLWEIMILGVIPLASLQQGHVEGIDGAQLLSVHLENSAIGIIANCFSFFAIMTSFLGVSLSLSDFLADGLKIKKSKLGRVMLYSLTFLPPVAFALTDPRAFFTALEYAGAFGVIILLGFLPALMVWKMRYSHRFVSTFKTPGGKLALLFVMITAGLVSALEIANKFGWTYGQ